MTFLNDLMTNIYLYWGIIIGLLIIDIILTTLCLKGHKREKIKKDFLEVEEQMEEQEKIEEAPVNEEILAIFNQMEEDSKLKPEEVVKKFEDDQELNAIISYQELVNSVNNNNIEIEEDDEGEVDFVQKLEAELNQEQPEEIKETLEDTLLETMDISDEQKKTDEPNYLDALDELDGENKFVNSDIISPVFGKISELTNYSISGENVVEVKQVAGTSPEEELKNNEAFLQALIKFRNNL